MTEWDFLSQLFERITGPGFGNRVLFWVIVVIVVLILIQISKIPWNPWTQIGDAIGRGINRQMIEEQKKVRKEIADVKKDLIEKDTGLHNEIRELDKRIKEGQDAVEEKRLEDKARTDRQRILRFADELRQGIRHSQEMFEQVLADIKEYQDYCETHPKFPNERAKASISIIESTYAKCLKEDDFE